LHGVVLETEPGAGLVVRVCALTAWKAIVVRRKLSKTLIIFTDAIVMGEIK